MKWELKWGSQIGTLVQIAKDSGQTPRPLLDRVKVNKAWSFFFEAFKRLSRCRGISPEGSQAITMQAVLAYCDLTGIRNENLRSLLLDIVQELDAVYLKHELESMKAS